MIQRQETPEPEERAESSVPAADESQDEGQGDVYTVHLEDFDGPLDLLLYLIQRDEIDIYDIPIAHITKQYLEFLDLLDVFDLDNAGEFLVMASTLMRIKARMLLPIQRPGEEEDDDVDPRDELVRRLLEYKKYKEASEKLAKQEEERRKFFLRGTDYSFADEDLEPPELSLSLFDLLRAVKNVLDQMQNQGSHEVYTEIYTVESQEQVIVERLEGGERLRFVDLFQHMRVKMEVVVTFIALLDLMKAQRVEVQQVGSYTDLWLVAREPDVAHEDELGLEVAAEAAAGESEEDGAKTGEEPAAPVQEDSADAT